MKKILFCLLLILETINGRAQWQEIGVTAHIEGTLSVIVKGQTTDSIAIRNGKVMEAGAWWHIQTMYDELPRRVLYWTRGGDGKDRNVHEWKGDVKVSRNDIENVGTIIEVHCNNEKVLTIVSTKKWTTAFEIPQKTLETVNLTNRTFNLSGKSVWFSRESPPNTSLLCYWYWELSSQNIGDGNYVKLSMKDGDGHLKDYASWTNVNVVMKKKGDGGRTYMVYDDMFLHLYIIEYTSGPEKGLWGVNLNSTLLQK